MFIRIGGIKMSIKFGFPQLFLIKLFKMKWAVTGYYLIGARLDKTPFIHIFTFGGFTIGIWLVSFFTPSFSFIGFLPEQETNNSAIL